MKESPERAGMGLLFSPESVFWRVNREWLIGFAGPRALLLELAHPLVAAGVAAHSDFRRRPFNRLYRTVALMASLNFGAAERARRSTRGINTCHRPVRGELAADTGPYLAGTPYDANDPLLKLWVLATLIDSVLVFHDRFIRPLGLAERQAYYRDGLVMARALGIPPEVMPPTYDDFTTYMDSMVNSDQLTVGDQAREVMAGLFAPAVLGPAVRLASFVSIGLLPERIRADFGLSWDAGKERRLERLAGITRRVRPVLPSVLCVHPLAVLAEWHPSYRREAVS